MKIGFIAIIYSVAFILISSVNIQNTVKNSKGNVLGVSNDTQSISAITYALADSSNYSLNKEDSSKYTFKPKYTDSLESTPGEFVFGKEEVVEAADTVSTNTDYYDGEKSLMQVSVMCSKSQDKASCLSQESCGWCGSSNSCIKGTTLGPLEKCVKSSFVFYKEVNSFNKSESGELGGVKYSIN